MRGRLKNSHRAVITALKNVVRNFRTLRIVANSCIIIYAYVVYDTSSALTTLSFKCLTRQGSKMFWPADANTFCGAFSKYVFSSSCSSTFFFIALPATEQRGKKMKLKQHESSLHEGFSRTTKTDNFYPFFSPVIIYTVYNITRMDRLLLPLRRVQ